MNDHLEKTGENYKWLNLHQLIKSLLKEKELASYEVRRIRYFTSLVHSSEKDPRKTTRQEVYLRALKTLSEIEVEIETGRFKKKNKDEKQSDVNLATRLVDDLWESASRGSLIDAVIVISNDSDFRSPIKLARDKFCVEAIVFSLDEKSKIQSDLKEVASRCEKIPMNLIKNSQFPTVVKKQPRIEKPREWETAKDFGKK